MNDTTPGAATVLVVDDQPANIRLLDAILTPRGYDVRTADSGEAALKTIAESEIDLVLLDIVMPVMDGYEVCRRIREQVDTAYLPVVMVTASGDEEKVKALEAGADDFLTKPVNQSELLAPRLLTLHNLRFLLKLTRGARQAIESGTFDSYKRDALERLGQWDP